MSNEDRSYLEALRNAALAVRFIEMMTRSVPSQNIDATKGMMELYQEKVEELYNLIRTDNLINLIAIINMVDRYISNPLIDERNFTRTMKVLFKPLHQSTDIIQKGN